MTAPNKTAFGGTIGKTIADSKPWWPAPGTPPQGAPNILVVLFDDVGFSDFGCYGSKIRTPTIDALAAQGVTFLNHYANAAPCSPALVATNRPSAAVSRRTRT